MSNLKGTNANELASENLLYSNIRLLIEESKQRVFTVVNAEITLLYWNIGRYISQNLKTDNSTDYGKNILPTLSAKLVEDYGKGFSARNLANSKKPELTIKNDIEALHNEGKMSTEIAFKDPYILDFLELRDTYSEKDLEQSIVYHLQQFILELGNDFAFLARQKRITIDTTDYYLDLLFFHRKLNRLVAIELKLGKFEHSHKSQMELYLRWLDKYEKQARENPPLGIILCATKSNELVELLELDATGIHVAEYLTSLPDKALLQSKLHKAIELSKLQLKKGGENG
jgi:predicted nuclease of restriction endonuclease-like (RecB) superfamily